MISSKYNGDGLMSSDMDTSEHFNCDCCGEDHAEVEGWMCETCLDESGCTRPDEGWPCGYCEECVEMEHVEAFRWSAEKAIRGQQ